MKSILYLGRTSFLLISFSIITVHNEYWDLPMILGVFYGVSFIFTPYFYAVFPLLALVILLVIWGKYGNRSDERRKYLINLGAYFLLVGSLFFLAYRNPGSNENMFAGLIPKVTLSVFIFFSVCFLVANSIGLIKLSTPKAS